MTEKDFKSIKFLNIEIERGEKVLKELRRGQDAEEYAKVLQENRAELIRKKAKTESLINGIVDDEIRLIFKLKFVDQKSWNFIANKLHYDRTTVFKKYKKYIKGLANE